MWSQSSFILSSGVRDGVRGYEEAVHPTHTDSNTPTTTTQRATIIIQSLKKAAALFYIYIIFDQISDKVRMQTHTVSQEKPSPLEVIR